MVSTKLMSQTYRASVPEGASDIISVSEIRVLAKKEGHHSCRARSNGATEV